MPDPRSEFASYTRAVHQPEIELLHARYIRHSFSPHFHDVFAIGEVEAGALTNSHRHHFPTVVAEGDLLAIPPSAVHTGKPVGGQGVLYRMMYIPPLIISQWLQWRNLPDKIHPSGTIHPDVTRQFLHLHQILGEPAYSRLEQESALTEVLAALFIPNLEPIHPHQGNSEKNSAVEIVKDFLTAHFADNISLCQLSDLAHMSAFHLLRIFQKQVGLSPHAFQTQLRIEKAKQLISQQETLTHIGVQVGFYDQSHFIKTFKSLVGVTPSQYPVS